MAKKKKTAKKVVAPKKVEKKEIAFAPSKIEVKKVEPKKEPVKEAEVKKEAKAEVKKETVVMPVATIKLSDVKKTVIERKPKPSEVKLTSKEQETFDNALFDIKRSAIERELFSGMTYSLTEVEHIAAKFGKATIEHFSPQSRQIAVVVDIEGVKIRVPQSGFISCRR